MAADGMYPNMPTRTGRRLLLPETKPNDAGTHHGVLGNERCGDDWGHGIRSIGSPSCGDSVPVGEGFLSMGGPAMMTDEELTEMEERK